MSNGKPQSKRDTIKQKKSKVIFVGRGFGLHFHPFIFASISSMAIQLIQIIHQIKKASQIPIETYGPSTIHLVSGHAAFFHIEIRRFLRRITCTAKCQSAESISTFRWQLTVNGIFDSVLLLCLDGNFAPCWFCGHIITGNWLNYGLYAGGDCLGHRCADIWIVFEGLLLTQAYRESFEGIS